MEKSCKNCRFCKKDGGMDDWFVCNNENSDCYEDWIEPYDSCDDWDGRNKK